MAVIKFEMSLIAGITSTHKLRASYCYQWRDWMWKNNPGITVFV